MKTSKEMLYKQIHDKIFPNSNITNGGGHVKTKLHWLESQYIVIKNTFSQTGSGLLLHDLSPVSWAWMLMKQERPLTHEEEEQCRRSRHSS